MGGLKTLPPGLRLIALSLFPEDGPRWQDGLWSVVLLFDRPPLEQADRTPTEANVDFAFETAPQDRLHAGARFSIHFGPTKD